MCNYCNTNYRILKTNDAYIWNQIYIRNCWALSFHPWKSGGSHLSAMCCTRTYPLTLLGYSSENWNHLIWGAKDRDYFGLESKFNELLIVQVFHPHCFIRNQLLFTLTFKIFFKLLFFLNCFFFLLRNLLSHFLKPFYIFPIVSFLIL